MPEKKDIGYIKFFIVIFFHLYMHWIIIKTDKRNTSEVPSSEVVEGVFSETGSINEVSADIITEKRFLRYN